MPAPPSACVMPAVMRPLELNVTAVSSATVSAAVL